MTAVMKQRVPSLPQMSLQRSTESDGAGVPGSALRAGLRASSMA